mgnify:CR=1 FL=1
MILGDLLHAAGDFPQAVDPRKNSSARDLLQRDISNVVEFFQRRRAGLEREPERMARNLWNLWKCGEV